MELPHAIADFDKCIALDPNYTKAYTKKANSHFGMKEYHKAQEFYEKGLSIDPNNNECKEGL